MINSFVVDHRLTLMTYNKPATGSEEQNSIALSNEKISHYKRNFVIIMLIKVKLLLNITKDQMKQREKTYSCKEYMLIQNRKDNTFVFLGFFWVAFLESCRAESKLGGCAGVRKPQAKTKAQTIIANIGSNMVRVLNSKATMFMQLIN